MCSRYLLVATGFAVVTSCHDTTRTGWENHGGPGAGEEIATARSAQTAVPTLTPIVPSQPLGKIDGSSTVGADGAYHYRVPLVVPDGIAGQQPDIDLTYSSRAGNGIVGVGWSLNASSAITRCKHTVSRDGIASSLDAPLFCLDGMKLIPISASLDSRGRYIYRLEHESFARIEAIPVTGSTVPALFVVKERDGTRRIYGGGDPDSNEGYESAKSSSLARVQVKTFQTSCTRRSVPPYCSPLATVQGSLSTYAWHLSAVAKLTPEGMPPGGSVGGVTPAGVDAIRYEYIAEASAGGLPLDSRANRLLSVIRYAKNTREVRLFYKVRPDPIESWESGFELSTASRLSSIEMWGPDATNTLSKLWTYGFDYRQVDPAGTERFTSNLTNRSLLRRINRCDAKNVCLPPTEFEWSEAALTRSLYTDSSLVPLGATAALDPRQHGRLLLADLDGNGMDDLIYNVGPSTSTNNLRVRMSSTGIPLGPEQVVTATSADLERSMAVDLDGDGRVELILSPTTPAGPGKYRAYKYMPGNPSVLGPVTAMDAVLVQVPAPESALGGTSFRRCGVDGDVCDDPNSARCPLYHQLPAGPTGELIPGLGGTPKLRLADVNGDGVLDLIAQLGTFPAPPVSNGCNYLPARIATLFGFKDSGQTALLMKPGTFTAFATVSAGIDDRFLLPSHEFAKPQVAIDLDGDSKAEFLTVDNRTFPDGSGDHGALRNMQDMALAGILNPNEILSDFNGDGLKDMVRAIRSFSTDCFGHVPGSACWQLGVSINTGHGFLPPKAVGQVALTSASDTEETSFASLDNIRSADFDGDGRDDLLMLAAYGAIPAPGEPSISGSTLRFAYPMVLLMNDGQAYRPTNLDSAGLRLWFRPEVPENYCYLAPDEVRAPCSSGTSGFAMTAVGDVDGNGLPDIVQMTQSSGRLQLEVTTLRFTPAGGGRPPSATGGI